jgi:hypothetical protein
MLAGIPSRPSSSGSSQTSSTTQRPTLCVTASRPVARPSRSPSPSVSRSSVGSRTARTGLPSSAAWLLREHEGRVREGTCVGSAAPFRKMASRGAAC